MKLRLFTAAIVLSGCTVHIPLPKTGSGTIRDAIHTATGFVLEVSKQAAATIDMGKMGVKKAQETVDDLKKRADQIQKGIETMKEGKELIEKGLAK